MPKYINTDELLETLGCAPVTMSVCLNVDECKGRIYERERVLRIIKDIPDANVVERKTGKWVEQPKDFDLCGVEYFACSGCGFECQLTYNFCPNCGADMRED